MFAPACSIIEPRPNSQPLKEQLAVSTNASQEYKCTPAPAPTIHSRERQAAAFAHTILAHVTCMLGIRFAS